MHVIAVVLPLFALVVVAVMAYRAGYLRGQAELLRQHQSTEAARNALRMTAILPHWRRVAGGAAYVCSGLLLCLFLFLAFRHAKGWGWIGLLGAWALWFALFMAGIWLAEWCWKPYREAQARRRQEQTETLRALGERASEENSR
jgi:hypothetical protein